LPLTGALSAITREWAWGGSAGKGVRVAVVDSGIDSDHPALAGAVRGGVGIEYDPSAPDSLRYVEEQAPQDVFGHGAASAAGMQAFGASAAGMQAAGAAAADASAAGVSAAGADAAGMQAFGASAQGASAEGASAFGAAAQGASVQSSVSWLDRLTAALGISDGGSGASNSKPNMY